jgi:hypothetical protein
MSAALPNDLLRGEFLATVNLLHRRRARDIAEGFIDAYVALHWLEWHGGTLRVTTTGDNVCRQLIQVLTATPSEAARATVPSPAAAAPPGDPPLAAEERAELWRQGAKSAARGESDTANPMLHRQNGPATTGETQHRWSARSGAWQDGHDLESAKVNDAPPPTARPAPVARPRKKPLRRTP